MGNSPESSALYAKATAHRKARRYKEAMALYQQIVENDATDKSESEYWLATFFHDGSGVEKDCAAAYRHYSAAAEAGHDKARLEMAYMLVQGEGVDSDTATGIRWLEQAAETDAYACNLLGRIYYGGQNNDSDDNVPKDYARALAWYQKALELVPKYSAAVYNMGLLHEYGGHGLKRDVPKAFELYCQALQYGNMLAPKKVRQLTNEMQPGFTLDLVNANLDLKALTEKINISRTLSIPILISGPKGSGRMALAEHFVQTLELRSLSKDILSLGRGAVAIQEAFAEAEKDKKALIFDNVGELLGSTNIHRTKEILSNCATVTREINHFSYPFICIVEDESKIEPQLADEFIFHIDLEYLTREQNNLAYKLYFKQEPPEEFAHIGALLGQDYRRVINRLFVLGEENNTGEIIATLKKISQKRCHSIIEDTSDRTFDTELINADVDLSDLIAKLQNLGGQNPFSILIYGPPGTGKSEFLRYLGKMLDVECIVKRGSDVLSKWTGESAQNIASTFKEALARKSFLIFDEAESLLSDRGDSDSRLHNVQQVNEMLTWMENHPLPFACTTNHMEKMDRAALRRFVFKMKFDYLTKAQARKAFTTFFQCEAPAALDGIGGLTVGDFAVVKKKAKIFGELHDSEKLVDLLRVESETKARIGVQHANPRGVEYNPALINADMDFAHLEEKLLAPKARKDFSLLLYGPPGTGKSQYLRHLAAKLDMEYLQVRASDLLSKWSGESERNIANAFKEARERQAFLVLDEADSMLSKRGDMEKSWQIQQVNELLTWMESHPLPFACTTNIVDKMDQAARRRFTFSIAFDYLERGQLAEAFRHFFHMEMPERLEYCEKLTPSIFANARKKAELFGVEDDAEEIATLIRQELDALDEDSKPIGFMRA